jgi:hypothetical protein
MKLLPFFIASALITTTYIWWQSGKHITVILPSEDQRKEMLGISNTPRVPLTPIKY